VLFAVSGALLDTLFFTIIIMVVIIAFAIVIKKDASEENERERERERIKNICLQVKNKQVVVPSGFCSTTE
jgi:Tfp pilus assembly protein PilO